MRNYSLFASIHEVVYTLNHHIATLKFCRIRGRGDSSLRKKKICLFFFSSKIYVCRRFIFAIRVSFAKREFLPGWSTRSRAHSTQSDRCATGALTWLCRYATYCTNEVAPMREMPRSMHQRTRRSIDAATKERGFTSPVQGYLLCTYIGYTSLRVNTPLRYFHRFAILLRRRNILYFHTFR